MSLDSCVNRQLSYCFGRDHGKSHFLLISSLLFHFPDFPLQNEPTDSWGKPVYTPKIAKLSTITKQDPSPGSPLNNPPRER